jgi:methylmalonyl-CoA mutase
MGPTNKSESLFNEFPPISTQEWEQVILKDLKGADYDKKLIWNSPEGIRVKPYYRSEDLGQLEHLGTLPGEFPFVRGTHDTGNSWLIRQDLLVEDFGEARENAIDMISKGVESINFQINDDHSVNGILALLAGLPLTDIEINFEGFDPEIVLDALDELVAGGKLDPAGFRGCLQFDPIGEFNLTGRFEGEEEMFDLAAEWIRRASTYPKLRVIGVNGRFFHNAGATIVQELGFSLAQANEYMVELTDRGIDPLEVNTRLSFHFSAGSNYFFEIAKFRAARMLWARVVEQYAGSPLQEGSMYVQAETSFWNKTVYDPYVNLLRSTTEAMSAVLGGVDALTVLPFDLTYEEPTAFAERIARNQQILLKGESNLDKVVDPAAGSYYIENLTRSIAEESWKLFQEAESKGGYVEAFYEGWIQDAIVTSAISRDQNIAQRREVLLGTNQYPNLTEEMLGKADPEIMVSPVADAAEAEAQPLNLYRVAEPFEQLRMETEQSDKRPVVFLLTIGNLAMRRARAGFATNFFGCAGYRIIDNNGFGSVAEGIKAASDSGADVVVLCSSDDEYAQMGAEFGKLAAGKMIPVIAGYPKDLVDELRKAGISHFIHIRSNVLQTLQSFNKLIFKS